MAARWLHLARLGWLALVVLALASCGGGGGGGDGERLTLNLSSASVTFTAIQDGATPAAHTVVASLSGGGTGYVVDPVVNGTGFSASFLITSDTTADILITPFAPTLAAGTYTGTVTLRVCADQNCSRDIAGSPAVINVSYTVQPKQGLAAAPLNLTFTQVRGSAAPAAQTLGLSDVGGLSYAWNAAVVYQSGGGWLSLNGGAGPVSGTSLPGSLSASVNALSTLGTVNALIRVTGNGNTLDVPVSYTLNEPSLTRSPSQLSFSASRQGATPATQNVTLSTQNGSTVEYSTTVSYGAGASGWLSAPASGTAPGTLGVAVNTTDLAIGNYNATVTLTTTGGQTVSFTVSYTVAAAAASFTPSSAAFTINPASTTTALSQTVSVGSTGVAFSWTAASNQPWVSVSPTSGTSSSTVTLALDPAQLDTLDPGLYSAAITFTYTPSGGTLTNTPLPVSLDLQLPKVTSVAPYVATSGTSQQVVLRGLGFLGAAGATVKFGSTASASSYTVLSDTEARVTHPALSAGGPLRVSVENQLGLSRSSADLVVVNAPGFAATTISYPDAVAKTPLNVVYDAERAALLVAVGAPIPGAANGRIYRFTFSGSVWSSPPPTTVAQLRDLALSLDGSKLIAVSDTTIRQFNAATLAAGTVSNAAFTSLEFFDGIALANDGKGIITTGFNGSGFTDAYRYTVADGVLTRTTGLYFASSGASEDGSLAVFVQGGLSPPAPVFRYDAGTSALAATSVASTANFPRPALDRHAAHILIGGTRIYGPNFQLMGTIPFANTVVLSPNGTRAYTYSSGTVRTYDLTTPPMLGAFSEVGTTLTPGNPGLGTVMTISPDGGTLFIAGDAAIVVMPAP